MFTCKLIFMSSYSIFLFSPSKVKKINRQFIYQWSRTGKATRFKLSFHTANSVCVTYCRTVYRCANTVYWRRKTYLSVFLRSFVSLSPFPHLSLSPLFIFLPISIFIAISISILFLRFLPEFWCSNIFAVTEHTRNQIFLVSYQIFFVFFKNFGLFWSKFAF